MKHAFKDTWQDKDCDSEESLSQESSSKKKREITKTGFDSSNPAGKFMSHKKTADALSIQNE